MKTKAIYGLLLAGGESRRMGRDKALLQREGQSQLARTMSLLQTVTDRAFVSARESQQNESERLRYDQIVDRYSGMGPVAGILSAMEMYPDVDWLVVACDLPNLDESTLRFLIESSAAETPFTAFRSSYDDLPEPLCAIYRSGSDTIVRRFVDEGLTCPRKILIRSETELLQQQDPASLDNVNTPDDLEQSRSRSAAL